MVVRAEVDQADGAVGHLVALLFVLSVAHPYQTHNEFVEGSLPRLLIVLLLVSFHVADLPQQEGPLLSHVDNMSDLVKQDLLPFRGLALYAAALLHLIGEFFLRFLKAPTL